jgi:surface polysaccharide O-acyltransferase-like enzyme|tara:strand:+ start:837 stop:1070 length:234 start_codon:yes stop_codon:yes gene_type:complete
MPRERIYAIDWLRMYDVFVVIMGHCIRFLDDKSSDVKLAHEGTNQYLNVIMLFGNMWVMPLFFFIAGVACNLSISSR